MCMFQVSARPAQQRYNQSLAPGPNSETAVMRLSGDLPSDLSIYICCHSPGPRLSAAIHAHRDCAFVEVTWRGHADFTEE